MLCISSSGETRKLTFQVKFDLEGQGQLPPKTIEILTKLFCTSGPNLVILAWIGNELWCGNTQNGVNSDFGVKFDLEGQSRLLHKTIRTLTKLLCPFVPNLVILAWTGPELLRGQASDWHTDWHMYTHTDTGNNNTRRLKVTSGKNVNIRIEFKWLIEIWCTCTYQILLFSNKLGKLKHSQKQAGYQHILQNGTSPGYRQQEGGSGSHGHFYGENIVTEIEVRVRKLERKLRRFQ